jgi:hypothetical protein
MIHGCHGQHLAAANQSMPISLMLSHCQTFAGLAACTSARQAVYSGWPSERGMIHQRMLTTGD